MVDAAALTRQGRIGAAALVAIGWVLSAPLVGAQENRIDISAGVGAGGDTNILRTNSLRGDQNEAALFVMPNVRLDIVRPLGAGSAFVRGELGYAFHNQNRFLNREAIDLNSGLTLRVAGQCRVAPTASLLRVQSDPADLPGNVANSFTLTRFEIDAACPRDAGVYPVASVRHSRSDNSLSDDRDKQLTGGRAGLSAKIPSVADIGIFAEHLSVDRNRRLGADGIVIDPSAAYDAVGLTAQRDVAARVSASAELRYEMLDPASDSLAQRNAFGGDLTVTYSPAPALRVSVTGRRGVSFTGETGTGYFVNTAVQLNGSARLSARTRLTARVQLAKRDYVSEDFLSSPFGPRSEDTELDAGGTLSYRLHPKIEAELDLRVRNRRADNPIYNFDNFRALFSLRFALIRRGLL